MRHSMFLFILIVIGIQSFSQEDPKLAAIVAEGKNLYKSEMAAWYGNDYFFENMKAKRSLFGGYLSYVIGDSSRCIFYSNEDSPKIIAAITFDSTFKLKTASVEGTFREFSPLEFQLYTLKTKAIKAMQGDKFFEQYKNTGLNLIPYVSASEKKVFVLTGPKDNGVVILGNDYVISFNDQLDIEDKQRIHKNILQFKNNNGEKSEGAIHTHLPSTGDYITSTDICTLMLYSKFMGWTQHIVISQNYVSIWMCKTNTVSTMERKAWDKIYGSN
jgi:hypothetical protein